MKNIHTKIVAFVVGAVVLGVNVHFVSAHGVLAFETKDVGDYTIVMEATGDTPALFINYPITYNFRIYEKGTEIEVPYDSSYIFLTKKSGQLIVQTETLPPRDFLPGSEIIVAVPEVGEYEFEVFFNREVEGEVKTTFNFSAVENATKDEVTATSTKNDEASSNIPPLYIWVGIALFVIGGLVGRFTKKSK